MSDLPARDPLTTNWPWCVHTTAAGLAIIHADGERLYGAYETAKRMNDYAAERAALLAQRDRYETALRGAEIRVAHLLRDVAAESSDRPTPPFDDLHPEVRERFLAMAREALAAAHNQDPPTL